MSRKPVPKLTRAKAFQSVPDLMTIKRYEHDLIVRDGDYSFMVKDVDLTAWEKFYWIVSFLISNMGKVLTIVYYFVKLVSIINMADIGKDRKTTIAAIIKIVVAVIGVLGVMIPAEISEALVIAAVALWAIVDFIQGLFTKDKDKDEPEKEK